MKNAEGERGANARQAIRYLESVRTAGNLLEGVSLPGGGTLRLEVNCVDVKLPEGFPEHKNDNRILKVCLGLQNGKTPVILVTKDIVVRVKAQMLGIQAEDFTTEQAPVSEEQYTGRCEVFVAEKKFEDFKKKHIAPEDVYQADESGEKLPVTLVPNQFVILKADQSARKTQLGRFDGKKIVLLAFQKKKLYGVSPRNVSKIFTGGLDGRCGGSAAGDRKGYGRHSKNLLHLGCRPARHAGAGGTGLPAHFDQPPQRPV